MSFFNRLEPSEAQVAAAAALPPIVHTGQGLPWTAEGVVRAITAPLQGFTRVHLDWTYHQTGSPQAFQLGGALAALATLVPTHWTVPGVPGGEAHGNLFVMLVGSQGASRKTTALKRVRETLGPDGADRVGDTPGSEAGLIKIVTEQQDNHVVLMYPEMGDFFAFTQDRNGGNQATVIKTKLLDAFDREPMTRRLSRSRHVAENPHVSVLGCINPRLIAQYVPASDWETGLMSRFLILWGESERNVLRTQADPRRDWLQSFSQSALKRSADDFGDCLGLEPDAEAYWIAWMLLVERNLPTGSRARICGPMARAPQIALRIALLLAFGEGFGWPAAASSKGAPWRIPRWILEIAVRIATMGYQSSLLLSEQAVEDADMRKRQQVLDAVGPEWTTLGEITRAAGLLRMRAVPVLDTLVEEGLVERQSSFGVNLPGGSTLSFRRVIVDEADVEAVAVADAAYTAAIIQRATAHHGIAPVADPAAASAASAPPPVASPTVLPVVQVRQHDHARRPHRRVTIELPRGFAPTEGSVLVTEGPVVPPGSVPPVPAEASPPVRHAPLTDDEIAGWSR